MAQVVITSDKKPEVEALIRSIPKAITGGPDPHGIGRGFRMRVAFGFVGLIARNFDNLGQGKAGDDGDKWPPNTPEYLAYQKGPKSSRRGKGRVNRWKDKPGSGELTVKQRKQWARFYRQGLLALESRMSIDEAKQAAAAFAWKRIKAQGGGTLLERYGNREDTILVDEGIGRRSLQPGELSESDVDAKYSSPDSSQVFDDEAPQVFVGTRVPYMVAHHRGSGNLPKRRLWPREFPDWWWEEILGLAMSGLRRIPEVLRSL